MVRPSIKHIPADDYVTKIIRFLPTEKLVEIGKLLEKNPCSQLVPYYLCYGDNNEYVSQAGIVRMVELEIKIRFQMLSDSLT